MKAKKSLGQNFLIDNDVIYKITSSFDVLENDLIIEIGPGRGALTKVLKDSNAQIIAYEKDTDLDNYLSNLIDDKTKIIYQDFLTADLVSDIKNISYNNLYIVGNLPYYITTPIIEHIINQRLEFKSLVIMVQKEVAERFMAKPGTKAYGYFTLYLNYYFDIELVTNVSKNCFYPVPKVDSAVIKLIYKRKATDVDTDYFSFVKKCFAMKRKSLKNNIGENNFNKIKDYLKEKEYNDNVRAEELSQEDFMNIYRIIFR